jgi:hypothetical protein
VSGPVQSTERASELQPQASVADPAFPQPPTLLGMELVKCRADGCGRRVFFATSVKSGKPTPLDPGVHMAAVFDREPDGVTCCQSVADFWWDLCQLASRYKWEALSDKILAVRGFALSHFGNCKRPQDFSGSGKVVADHRRRMTETLRRVADRLSGPGRTLGPDECREIREMCRAAADNTPEEQ